MRGRLFHWFTALMVVVAMALAVGGSVGTAAAAAGTTCTVSNGTTTCTTTGATGAILGTCTVTGAATCVPIITSGTSNTTSGNLNALRGELTPNVGAVLTNSVTAPLIKGGMFILSLVLLYYLFMSIFHLAGKIHAQAQGAGIDHKNLHGALFSVALLLLLVAGGATWLLIGVVQGIQSLLHA